MIRKLFFICFFFIAYSSAQSQIRRYYLDEDDKFIDDPSKATSYVNVMQDSLDSTWKMHMYSLTDTLLVIGSFKDAQLSIPQGKFTYFLTTPPHTKRQYNNKSNQIENIFSPTGYELDMVGNYINGQKEGEWTHYNSKGGLASTTTWKNGKKNGLYRTYGLDSQKIMFEGNYVDGKREGTWITFAASGAKVAEETYKNDQVTHSVNHADKVAPTEKINDSKPPSDFKRSLSEKLKKIDFGNVKDHIMLTFKTTKEGHLVCESFVAMKGFSDESIISIINAITNSPSWKPASKENGEAVEQIFPIFIEVPGLEIQIGLGPIGKELNKRLDTIVH